MSENRQEMLDKEMEWSIAILDWAAELEDVHPELYLVTGTWSNFVSSPHILFPYDNGVFCGLAIWMVDKEPSQEQVNSINTYLDMAGSLGRNYAAVASHGSPLFAIQAIKDYLATGGISINIQ